ncbi:nucleotidyltransferase [Sphingomonas sp. ID1715]|uniref:SMODS domain-containing nucleotidyltransferase n=1 Tax=Sphingomonas sp. ID1715 TaxID=1656898 RepID=UPI001489C34A|nr:nucleotidyltransferase [Sphingomonas sp. ID1715]NNM78031.1 nucleotidyltransferase [Sphingomonas sp. ID1715]
MAKLVSQFGDFLRDTVNLNQSRIDSLESNVEALQRFIRQCTWEPTIRGFEEQGSWAHDTIIKPVDSGEFDADLLVIVDPVEDWTAGEYVRSLGKVFADSATYADKAKTWDYCVTVTYAGERKVDIAPCVRGRLFEGSLEVCNRTTDSFERSEPIEYTKWLRERNALSGSNSFRKVTRLLKYLRDIKTTFTCPSVLLTTLLGKQIEWFDKDSADFADVPTTLRTVIGRLDDWLQGRPTKPRVENPKLPSEDFAAGWTDVQYSNFRAFIARYRGWIDEAYEEEDRDASIKAWRRVFGDEFAKSHVIRATARVDEGVSLVASLLTSTAHHADGIVDLVKRLGVSILPSWFNQPPHMQSPPWPAVGTLSTNVQILANWQASQHAASKRPVQRDDTLPRHGGIWFDLTINHGDTLPSGYRVQWRVTNTGVMAMALKQGRGGFYPPTSGNRRWESLQYRGVHIVEAFVIRRSDDVLVAKSPPFNVIIE